MSLCLHDINELNNRLRIQCEILFFTFPTKWNEVYDLTLRKEMFMNELIWHHHRVFVYVFI